MSMKYKVIIIGIIILQFSCTNHSNTRNEVSLKTQMDSTSVVFQNDSTDSIDTLKNVHQIGYKKYKSDYDYYIDMQKT